MAIHYKNWKALKPGDIVDVVAPSCGCSGEEITLAANFLESLDLVPRIPEDLVDESALAVCANSDTYRLNHLKESLINKSSKAVWCLRGGYGATRIISDLYKIRQPRQSKLFIGFSDITALHVFLYQRWRWCVLHAPVLFQLGLNTVDESSKELLKNVIFGDQNKLAYDNLIPLNTAAKTAKSLYSRIVGGNLCLLQSSLGTNWHIKGKNHIIFIEEIGERGYAVDRMLTHLTQASVFEEAQAVIFGDMIGGLEKDGISLNEPVIRTFAEQSPIPVLRCEGFGHGTTNNPLPIGSQVILKLGPKKATLTCNTGLVE